MLISGYLGGRAHTAAQLAKVRAELHLNQPVYDQYFYYLGNLLTGKWGYMAPTELFDSGTPVLVEFERRFPPTMELTIIATILMFLMGLPMGMYSAVKRDRLTDQASRVISLVGYCVPTFWLGLIVLIVLGPASVVPAQFRLLGTGQIPPAFYHVNVNGVITVPQWINTKVTGLTRPTGFLLIDTLYYGDVSAFFAGLYTVFWPALTVAFTNFAVLVRFLRSSMLEVLGQDYIKMARSKGVPESSILKKHARRNALSSTTTVMGLLFASLLSGVVVTETVFGWPGMGRWLYSAALGNDMVSIMAIVFVFALIIVLVNLIVDVLYSYLDPRVRLQ